MPTNTLNSSVVAKVTELLRSDFGPEITYYTHDNVATTAHQTGMPVEGSWTQILREEEIVTRLPPRGDRFIELERSLTALYNFLLFEEDKETAYLNFIAAQTNNNEIKAEDVLSQKSFNAIYQLVNNILGVSNEVFITNQNVLMYLILLSDIGKSPAVKDIIRQNNFPIALEQDSDDLMTAILQLPIDDIYKILPCIAFLSDEQQQLLIAIYPMMRACFGHIHFLERGEKTFQIIGEGLVKIEPAKRLQALELVYLAQYFDGMGAQGQRNMFGSFTCTNDFAKSYDAMYLNLLSFEQVLRSSNDDISAASKVVFQDYLNLRAGWLGLNTSKPSTAFLTRLGCNIRGMTPQMGVLLLEEYINLTDSIQTLLQKQLGFEQDGFEGWTKVNYFATSMQNMSRVSFANDELVKAVSQAMDASICIALLVERLASEFSVELHDEKRSISLGEVAYLSDKEPASFNPTTFNPHRFTLNKEINKVVRVEPSKAEVDLSPRSRLSYSQMYGSIFRSVRRLDEKSETAEMDEIPTVRLT
jgi:hypothetical protein